MLWNLEGPDVKECAVSFDMLPYSKSSFRPTCFFVPSKCQLIESYLTPIIQFWISKNFSSTSKLEYWSTRIGKVLLVLRYLDFPTCASRKPHIWNFYESLNWRWYIFKYLSDGIFSDFVPYFEKLVSWTCENVQIKFLFCWSSESEIFETIGFNSSAVVSFEMFFRQFRNIFEGELVCVRSNFMHHIDWKSWQCYCASCMKINRKIKL